MVKLRDVAAGSVWLFDTGSTPGPSSTASSGMPTDEAREVLLWEPSCSKALRPTSMPPLESVMLGVAGPPPCEVQL